MNKYANKTPTDLARSMAVPVMEWIGKRIQQVENKK